jgi:hypothetical protein
LEVASVGTDTSIEAQASHYKLSLLASLGGLAIFAPLAFLLLGKLAFGAGSEARSEAAGVARLGIAGIMITGGLLPMFLVLRLVSVKNKPAVNYSFHALHWVSFLTTLTFCCLTIPAILSGDAESLVFAAVALTLFPSEMGSYRWVPCVILAILSVGVFVVCLNLDALLAAAMCLLAALLCGVWPPLKRKGEQAILGHIRV